MFRMLSCFNLKAGISIDESRCSLADHTAHLQALDLVDSTGPIGRRQSDTIMDTDNEREHQYFATMSCRDRAQCDRSEDYIHGHQQPGDRSHPEMYSKVADPVFICWEDL
jgi:hypothetical protein